MEKIEGIGCRIEYKHSFPQVGTLIIQGQKRTIMADPSCEQDYQKLIELISQLPELDQTRVIWRLKSPMTLEGVLEGINEIRLSSEDDNIFLQAQQEQQEQENKENLNCCTRCCTGCQTL